MRRRRKRIPEGQRTLIGDAVEPNDNVTVPIGPVTLSRMTVETLGLPELLDSLKRRQGASVTDVTVALMAHAIQMRGLSINRMEDILDDPHRQDVYGLDDDVDKNDLYRTGRILGRNIDRIVRHMNRQLQSRLDVRFEDVLLDWSASYVDGKPTGIIKFGYTKDHRSDRPQINIGMAMESVSGLLCGLTVVAGNTNDSKHFKETFGQVEPFLAPGTLVVFDAGAYSEKNGKLVAKKHNFLTRVQITDSDQKYIVIDPGRWLRVDDDVRAYMYRGNNHRCKVIFYSQKRHDELIAGYYAKAERDYDEAIELKNMVGKGKPRKKYRNSNYFLKTSVGYVFPLDMIDREESIERAVQARITGREGYFVLACSKVMLPGDMLRTYRSRSKIEDAFRDLKHGIDIRPLRCRDEDSLKGRVLIAYLALTAMYLSKYLSPQLSTMTAETFSNELCSFSLTMEVSEGRVVRRIYSNFNDTIRAIMAGFERIPSHIGAGRLRTKAGT